MLSELIQLGLTNGEVRIYLSLLKLVSSKVGSIVRIQGFPILKYTMYWKD